MTVPLIAFLSFGFMEMLVVGIVALLVFGGELPDVMRNVGRAYAKFRQGLNEISKPVRDELRNVTDTSSSRRAPRKPKREVPEARSGPPEDAASDRPGGTPAPWISDEPPPV